MEITARCTRGAVQQLDLLLARAGNSLMTGDDGVMLAAVTAPEADGAVTNKLLDAFSTLTQP